MKVWVIWHLEPGYEISIVKVTSTEQAAKDYVHEYEKGNYVRTEYARQYADYESFDLDEVEENQGKLPL